MKWFCKIITKGTIWLLIIAVVAASIISVLYHYNKIDTAQTLEIAALTTLVLITAWYATQTATMAKEMKEQRYDAVRPVIDIRRDIARADTDNRALIEAFAASSEDTSCGLSCILCNIGLGPAIDVYSFIQHPEREQLRWDFGTLATRRKTQRMNFSLNHQNNRMVLVAYYKDVYGRDFESRREVTLDKERHDWKIHPLETQIRKITKEEAQQ